MINYKLDFYYDEAKETMFIYIPISVKTLLYFKSKYKHVEVRDVRKEKRW